VLLKKPRTIALRIFQSAVPRLSFVVAAFIKQYEKKSFKQAQTFAEKQKGDR